MNPLQMLFFASLFIDDYFFKEGKLLNLFLLAAFIYWISSLFLKKSIYQNSQRKLQMAIYSQSEDPTIMCKIKLRTDVAKKYIEEKSKELGKKISWTLYVAKVIGNTIIEYPEILNALKFSKAVPKNTADISLLVNIEGKVRTHIYE